MTEEYIRREDAIDYIEGFVTMNKYYHPHSKRTTIPIAEAIARINETPSADVQPVVHGEWETEICDDGYGAYNLFVCSLCGSESAKRFNYCRECGARMDGISNAK